MFLFSYDLHYAVEPQKYIYNVDHQYGDTYGTPTDTTYTESDARLDLSETEKEENPVYVEVGDRVTYKIKLNNTITNWSNSPYYKPDEVLVNIVDTLPNSYSDLEVKDSSGNNMTYTTITGGFRINDILLRANSSIVITVSLTVQEDTRGTIEENNIKIINMRNTNRYEFFTAEPNTLLYNTTPTSSSDWYKLNDYNVKTDK